MRRTAQLLLCLGLAAAVAAAWAPPLLAQGVTTGEISGVIRDPDGVPLPGVTVTAIHTPTGTRYVAITRGDGLYNIHNVRIGGPYTIRVELQGFTTLERTDLMVTLGEQLAVQFTMQLRAVEEIITVTAASDPIINPSRTGAESRVSTQEIEQLPTIQRELADFARLDPYFTPQPSDNADPAGISVAGRNNRYNNIQIDGSVNNDLFGLAAQGTPGGQTEVNPISLDAIKELNLVVSPYDVRQGGFSGGGVNAVTRSGANLFSGSAFYFRREAGMVGTIDETSVGSFSDNVYGGRFGGPIVRDEVFFFVAYEGTRRSSPSGYSIDGSSGQEFGAIDEAQGFRDILRDQYGHDPGGFEEFTRNTENDNLFGRLDWNLNQDHQLTVRHNFVDGTNQIHRPGRTFYQWPDNFYFIDIQTNSFVAQLDSVFSSDMYNEARFTFQTIKGPRFGPEPFPAINVDLADGRTFAAGTERFSTANNLDQTIFEFNDDLTFSRGRHSFVFGTHNEIFDFKNLFIRDNFGFYGFDSLEDLERGWAQSFDHSFSATGDPQQAAEFGVWQFGVYAGDTWTATDRVTVTGGLRIDIPYFLDDPTRNSDAEDIFGFRTDITPSGNVLWSPRVGLNFDPLGDGTQQVRGGIGLFSGRPPYVWMSNQFGNTGIEFTRISLFLRRPVTATNHIPFNPDPFNQPTNVGNAATNEIDLVTEDFEYPSVVRATAGYDREIGWQDMTATAELIYSWTTNDILYRNLNIAPTGATLFDGRPIFGRFDSSFRDVILLDNTAEGKQWNLLFKVQRPFRDNWMITGSYMYGDADSINDGNSSQARSNWRFVPISTDPNHPDLARSDYALGHRINVTAAFDVPVRDTAVRLSFFYDRQSGRPYSSTFSRDVNGDFESNDLMWVPNNVSDVVVTGGTAEQLEAYIANDPGLDEHRGQIAPRNASRAPWRNFSDFRASLEVPTGSPARVELSLDIRNVFNLLNKDWGRIQYANFDELSPVRFDGIDPATGKPTYNLQFVARNPQSKFSTDDLRSRWQMRFGARVTF